jgi:phosphomannomutase
MSSRKNGRQIIKNWESKKHHVEEKIKRFIDSAPIDEQVKRKSLSSTGVFANLSKWMEDIYIDKFSPNAKTGIMKAIDSNKRWADIAEVFYTDIEFGTGGIRGRAVIQDDELITLRDEGIYAPFLRGPNTINDLVFLQISSAIAKFGRDKKFNSITIGYDSRIRGKDFAHLVAGVFIAYGYTVYLFDDVVPYPEVTFAIPYMRTDMGILISASHNDRRYNGYKLSCANGSQFSIKDRSIILNEYISKTGFESVKYVELTKVHNDQLKFLGGGYKYPHLEYYNYKPNPIDVHTGHFSHVLDFLIDRKLIRNQADDIHVAYSAYHGAGGPTVKRLIDSLGIIKLDVIASLYKVDGMFPVFDDPNFLSPKGKKIYQQPDPGEPRAAKLALSHYIKEYGDRVKDVDVLIGTDPDADRTGISVKIPEQYKEIYPTDDHMTLLDADTAWSLIIWYRLNNWEKITGLKKMNLNKKNCFLVQSHTTTDIMPLLAEKHGLGWIKTWVGFAQLATAVEKVWNKDLKENYFTSPYRTDDFRSIYKYKKISPAAKYNFAALEQSNGFSILGSKPPSAYELGKYGHVRDKDGTFAALLFFDVVAYAKKMGKSILELVDENLYLDPDIGLIRTGYRAAPQYGQYEGLEGRSLKLEILRKALDLTKKIQKGVNIGNKRVTKYEVYLTGKYDIQHGNVDGFKSSDRKTYKFPDEGIRFFFGDEFNHLTIRPSGTSQSLRLHIQLRDRNVSKGNLKSKRIKMENEIQTIFQDIGNKIGIDWNE